MAEVVIPANLAATVVAWTGDGGRDWLARLPGLVAEVAEAWDLEVGPPFEPGGNISWVAPARRRLDGIDAVLKLQYPDPESAPEAAGLAAWHGDGAVRLLEHDAHRWALLLERCQPGHAVGGEADPLRSARVGAAIGARLHAAPVPPRLPTLAAVQCAWADQLEARLATHPAADPGLGRRALATMRAGSDDDPSAVLLHGDLNPTNVLAAAREPWLAIDPKPMAGDAAYDGSRLVAQPDPLVESHSARIVARRLDVVADGLGVDRGRLAEWCLVAAIEMGTSAGARGEVAASERSQAHVGLLAPHLP